MRGDDSDQGSVLSYVPMAQRIPKDHSLRPTREMVDGALRELSPRFDRPGQPDGGLPRREAEQRDAPVDHRSENRHGLVVEAMLTEADGYAEREAALAMLEGVAPRSPVAAEADREVFGWMKTVGLLRKTRYRGIERAG